MTNSSYALRQSLLTLLKSHAPLTALVGAGGIYDTPPRTARPPYVCVGSHRARDWSANALDGTEHRIELLIFSSYEGSKEINEITHQIESSIQAASLVLQGHHLINLRHIETIVSRPSSEKALTRAEMIFRAVTHA